MTFIPSGRFNLVGDLSPEQLLQFRKDLRPVGNSNAGAEIIWESNPKIVPPSTSSADTPAKPLNQDRVKLIPTIGVKAEKADVSQSQSKPKRPLPPIPVKKISSPADTQPPEAVSKKKNAFVRFVQRICHAIKNFFLAIARIFNLISKEIGSLNRVQIGNVVVYDAKLNESHPPSPEDKSIETKEEEKVVPNLDNEIFENAHVNVPPPPTPPPLNILKKSPSMHYMQSKNVTPISVQGEPNSESSTGSVFKKKIDEKIANQPKGLFEHLADGINEYRLGLCSSDSEDFEENNGLLKFTFKNPKQVETIVKLNLLNGNAEIEKRVPMEPAHQTAQAEVGQLLMKVFEERPLVFSNNLGTESSDSISSSPENDEEWD